MPLTKSNSVVIDIDDVSSTLKSDLVSTGIRTYVDSQITSLDNSFTADLTAATMSIDSQITTINSSISNLQSNRFLIANLFNEITTSTNRGIARSNLGIGDPTTSIPGLVRFATPTEAQTANPAIDAALNVRTFSSSLMNLLDSNFTPSSLAGYALSTNGSSFTYDLFGPLKIVFGRTGIPTGANTVSAAVTFDTPFLNNVIMVQVNPNDGPNSGWAPWSVLIRSKSNTGFTANFDSANSGAHWTRTNNYFLWMAIGY